MSTSSATPAAVGTAAGAPAETAEPTATETPSIMIAAVGEIMLARDVTDQMASNGVLSPFERILPLFAGADLVIGNMEGTFTERGEPLEKEYTFRTPPAFAEGIARAGFDAVSLANNHSYDFGTIGLLDTTDALDAAGVPHFGAGADERSAYAPLFFRVGSQTVALLGSDAIGETRAALGAEPGVAWADDRAVSAVATAALEADYVVVMVHAGTEYSGTPTVEQARFARALIDAGADVVIGSHPHVLQPWERYGDGLILHSLGNFVFDLDADDLATLGVMPFQSAVARITLSPNAPPRVSFSPVMIDVDENRPRPATAEEAAGISRALGGLDSGAR
ncbi:MAG: CapA family protein [Chloroflexi bacterium]|nr:CapA family protein [Chloroflexota bacterium]MDA1146510.1 CapA family protein [Chloroflexota bacterium]